MGIFALVPTDEIAPDAASPEDAIKGLLTAALVRGGLKFTWLDPWRLDLVMNGRLVQAHVGEVVRSWRLAPESRRSEVVDKWVRTTLGLPLWEERREQVTRTFLAAEHRLLLRLQPAGLARADDALVRPYAPGIDMGVFVDVDRPGNSIARAASALRTDELAAWDVPESEVRAAARANTRRVIEPWHLGIQELEYGARVSLIVSEDSHGASPALFVPEVLPAPAPHGVLLAIPQHDTVMLHVITDKKRTAEAVPWMVGRAARMFAALPQPVSPELYWWHDGHATLVAVDRTSDYWQIKPDPEFMAVYATLPTTAPVSA